MFVTPDSVVPNMFDPQDLNRYSYCRNNPLIYVDPSGHTLGNTETGKNDGADDDKGSIQTDKAWEAAGKAEIKAQFERKLQEYINLTRKPLYDLEGYLKDYRMPIANTYSKMNNKKIMEMDPSIRANVTALVNFCYDVLGLKVGIRDVRRSIGDQNTIYAYGRTVINPNTGSWKTATKAIGGFSAHNYGVAFDVFIENVPNNNQSQIDALRTVASVAQGLGKFGLGLDWGGTFGDNPHFQNINWRSVIPSNIRDILKSMALDVVK